MAAKPKTVSTVIPARPRRAIVNSPSALSPLPLTEATAANTRVAEVDLDDTIDVYVPTAFPFTLDNHQVIDINVGVQPMPRAWAEHWFVKGMGVVVYDRSSH
jgi:hypothetical protein